MSKRLISPTGKDIVLAPSMPNAGIELAYQVQLDRLIADMHASIVYWIKAQYRKTPPEALAMDASPARAINRVIAVLAKRWADKFAQAAGPMALKFATGAAGHTDRSLQAALKKSGITVKFRMTRAQNDAVQAQIAENVGLIKSIASQHFTQIQGSVMRSVQKGRDLGGLVKELEAQYGVTRRRASVIAQDQSNKATAIITKVRRDELGITESIWQHSSAGRAPRPSHVKANGKRFDSAKGLLIDGELIQPGELINCRCFSRSVIPGLG